MQSAGYPQLSYKAEWPELKRRIEDRLAFLIAEIAKPGVNLDDTNVLRGRIAELRSIIDTTEPKTIIPPTIAASDRGSGY